MSLLGGSSLEPRPSSQEGDVWTGLAIGLSINILVFGFGVIFMAMSGAYALEPFLAAIGLTQLIYIVPMILVARSAGRVGRVKGLIIATSITLILNAACWSAY